MTLLTEHIEAGWHEVERGEFGRWVAERYHARPGATSSTIRVEAPTSGKLREAVTWRQSQLAGTEERAKDTITDDGTAVTGDQHESLKTEGLTVLGAEQVTEPFANEDVAAAEAGVDKSEAAEQEPAGPPDAADQERVAPADAEGSGEPESQSTPSDEVYATEAAEDAAEELGVDLTQVEGTGQDGRVLKGDVEAAASDDPKE
jgi:pyruvate/2-oxoglutarate dehydrogenase complex dihydrolipoamide acyltransferase (E2) component